MKITAHEHLQRPRLGNRRKKITCFCSIYLGRVSVKETPVNYLGETKEFGLNFPSFKPVVTATETPFVYSGTNRAGQCLATPWLKDFCLQADTRRN